MKKAFLFCAVIAVIISACTTQKQTSTVVNDDVYSPGYNNRSNPRVKFSESTASGTQVITSPDLSTTKTPASSTFADDYNDYSYSDRINRFNSKDTTKGYFDESYNSEATVSGGVSSNPDVNLYFGTGFGLGGFYGSSFSLGFGWGYPYDPWGWNYGWGYPYYGYPWGYPYYSWYNPWYSPCCYCYGYYDWYPPYYTNTYYGSRKSLYNTSGDLNARNSRTSATTAISSQNRNSRTGEVPGYSRNSGSTLNNNSASRVNPSGQEQYRYTRSTGSRQSGYNKSIVQNRTTVREQPKPRFIKPGSEVGNQRTTGNQRSTNVQRSGGATQSYSSPVYRQPKSSQEYLSPRTQNPASSRSNQSTSVRSSGQNTQSGSRPTITPRSTTPGSFSAPSRNESQRYSAPVRSTPSYSTPSRSGSGSYSAPSGSGGSYSAPSRSGGGSGTSAPSGGSSGGGGRRR